MSVTRDKALDVALSSKDDLQRAIDSSKRLRGGGTKKSHMRIRDIMYGSGRATKTLAIHHNMYKAEVECVWYSLSTVRLKDVYSSMSIKDTGEIILTLSQDMIDLHLIDTVQICQGLSEACVSATVVGQCEILLVGATANIVNSVVRTTSLNSSPEEWTCYEGDPVVTVFQGDKYMNVVRHCDVVLSTDAPLNVSYMGKVRSAMLYRRYLSGPNVDLMVGTLLCSNPSLLAYDYSTLAYDDPIKRLTVRDLINSMVSMALSNKEDDLNSSESSLMVKGHCSRS